MPAGQGSIFKTQREPYPIIDINIFYMAPQIHQGPGKGVLEMIRAIGMPEKSPRNLCEALSQSFRMIANNIGLWLNLLAKSL